MATNSYAMKGGSWAVPTAKLMSNNNKNGKTFGLVAPVKAAPKKAAKKFDPANYAKAKKRVFGV